MIKTPFLAVDGIIKLYDENENLIDEANDLIIECITNPKHCILLEKK